ncbi:MAG: hypothetical protein SH857_08630 [Chitinophagales bacterium]|nr:hypothetical protein [Chitinophagales bacterium]
MEGIRQVNKWMGFIPAVSIMCWLVMVTIGVLMFGRLPIYGHDPDPYSLGIDWLDLIALIFTFISLFTIPIGLIMTIGLKVGKVRFNRFEWISISTTIVSVIAFFVLKYAMSETFLWVMD